MNSEKVSGVVRGSTPSEIARPQGRLEPAEATRGMVGRVIEIDPRQVVFFKSIVEASEGVASIFGEHGGVLWVTTPASRLGALDALLADLSVDLPLRSLAWVNGVD